MKKNNKKTDTLFARQSFVNFIIFIGMLIGPGALLQLRSDIMSMISLFVDCFNEIRPIAWVFQEMIKRFIS